MLYKVEVLGVGIGDYAPLSTYYEAHTESDAIKMGARISGAIAVSHNIKISLCYGITPVRTVINRTCAKQEAW